MSLLPQRFRWTTFDVSSILPQGWQEELLVVGREHRRKKVLHPPHSTSRESIVVADLPVLTVRGVEMWEALPWLVKLYQNEFRILAEQYAGVPVMAAKDKRYAVVMNVQERDGSRYECHVDTNPIEGLLYVTSHPKGSGGELVIANDLLAQSTEEVDADCSELYPVSGHLVFFDGRTHPHYVRRLLSSNFRAAVGMNYYTDKDPEVDRPGDLNEYLYGER